MSVTALGYLRISTSRRAEWDSFASDILGAQVTSQEECSTVRIDSRSHRLHISDGDRESVDGIGWEVPTREALEELVSRLEAAGRTVERATADEARARRVSGLVHVIDPAGYRLDLFHGQLDDAAVMVSPTAARFVTRNMGFGHVVLGTAELDAMIDFYVDVLGFRLSDTLMLGSARTVFLHCNRRHHSLALAEAPESFLHHIMFEVEDVDMVGRAWDQVRRREVPITSDLGRHTNDQMFSFYVRTPSGFEMEYGQGGLLIDDEWTVTEWTKPSFWGHRSPRRSAS